MGPRDRKLQDNVDQYKLRIIIIGGRKYGERGRKKPLHVL